MKFLITALAITVGVAVGEALDVLGVSVWLYLPANAVACFVTWMVLGTIFLTEDDKA